MGKLTKFKPIAKESQSKTNVLKKWKGHFEKVFQGTRKVRNTRANALETTMLTWTSLRAIRRATNRSTIPRKSMMPPTPIKHQRMIIIHDKKTRQKLLLMTISSQNKHYPGAHVQTTVRIFRILQPQKHVRALQLTSRVHLHFLIPLKLSQ